MSGEARNQAAYLQEQLQHAIALQNRGSVQEAIALYRRILAENPGVAAAWYRLGQIAFQAGSARQCIDLLERAVAADNSVAEYRFRLALAWLAAKEPATALVHLKQVLQLDPTHVAARLKSGLVHLQLGDREAAADAIQRAVLLQPALRDAHRSERLSDAARREIATANAVLRERYLQLLDETVQWLQQQYEAKELPRILASLRILTGQEEKRFCDPLQRPEFLLFPDMPAKPWFERAEFDWCGIVEDNYATISAEYAAVRENSADFAPYIHGAPDGGEAITRQGTDFSTLADSRKWTAFHLDMAGPLAQQRARCPQTAATMDAIPLARAAGYMPEVFFSLLEPGAHIVPHFGQMNVRLTAHLALSIPPDCGIRVGGETRQWHEGEILVFDDSFEHEAWNRSDAERAVLIFEVWHPALKPAEIAGLQHFFAARHAWMSRFD